MIGSAKDLYRSEQEVDMMGRLDDITLEKLHEVCEQTEGEKPRERVLAAIGRKQSAQIDTLAERHGIVEKTIRNLARSGCRATGWAGSLRRSSPWWSFKTHHRTA